MKKFLLVTVLLLEAWVSLAQSDDMLFYYPDGKPYKRACKNIADINGDFDWDGRIKTFSPMCWDSTRYDCFVVIGYKLFSDQPLWILTNTSEKIPEFIKSFNYHEYLESPNFDYDLSKQIAKKTLRNDFILSAFGVPDKIDQEENASETKERWSYFDRAVIFTFENGIVTAYQRFTDRSGVERRK